VELHLLLHRRPENDTVGLEQELDLWCGVIRTEAGKRIASFELTYTFPLINRALGSSDTFLGYGAICMLGAAFVFAFVPETKGRTLEEIETRVLFAK